ncbi:hypothetical protein HZA98_01975 [Candidatus Woesearchaeota archaeon]|nr:hypothetical protein [Candidatus Woesearchaeota archaeon]
MDVRVLKQKLQRLQDTLIKKSYYADKDTRGLAGKNYDALISNTLSGIEDSLWKVVGSLEKKEQRLELFVLLDGLKKSTDIRMMLMILSRMDALLGEVKDPAGFTFSLGKLPADIKAEMFADLQELQRCYDAKCYRSCVILCGRLLEIGLHRKYYDTTKIDILEKSPGIGLGNLVAKLVEKGITVDPGLTQQIHLINNVRIFSVHKKKEAFSPSQAQTHAIILFTLDTLEKLFHA